MDSNVCYNIVQSIPTKRQIDNDDYFLMHQSISTAPSICPPILISFAGAWLFKHPCPQEFVISEEKLFVI